MPVLWREIDLKGDERQGRVIYNVIFGDYG